MNFMEVAQKWAELIFQIVAISLQTIAMIAFPEYCNCAII